MGIPIMTTTIIVKQKDEHEDDDGHDHSGGSSDSTFKMFLPAIIGVVATWQPSHFSRVYAIYGGIFIVLALLWGWKVGV